MNRLALALLLVGCAHHATPRDELPPPNVRVEPSAEDGKACARVAALGCMPASDCTRVISDARTDHIQVPSACLAQAADVAALRRCGDVGTLTFECAK